MERGKRKSSGFSLYDDDDDVKAPEPESKKASLENPLKSTEKDCVEHKEVSCGPNGLVPEAEKESSNNTNKSQIKMLSVLGAKRGERDDMQDAHLLLDHFDLGKPWLNRCALYGIYDGHAGARAATYCEEKIPSTLQSKLSSLSDLPTLEKSLKKTFTETYKAIDDGFLKKARLEKPVWKDGATASTVLILNNAVYVANIGDSRVVVGRKPAAADSLVGIQLTVDHNPIVYDERMRIQKAGGTVLNGRINGVIEVSRSIGDGPFKSYGVICTPDMKKLTITENDKFLIAACDGLWKSFSNEEAVKYAYEKLTIYLSTPEENVADKSKSEVELAAYQKVVNELATEAVKRRCGDNVSVIIIKLNDL